MHPRYGRRLPLTDAQGRLVCLLAWSVPSASILIATVLNLFDEPRAIPFFVSEVDEKGLQDVVFTAGLSAAGLVQLVYAWHLYHTLDAQRPHLWFLATLVGLVAAVNCVLVSHYDMFDYIDEHIVTAMLAFGGGVVWAVLSVPALGRHGTVAGQRMRKIGGAMAAIGFVVMLAAFNPVASQIDASGMTTKEFLNEVQDAVVVAAPAEYVLVAGLMICIASYMHELK